MKRISLLIILVFLLTGCVNSSELNNNISLKKDGVTELAETEQENAFKGIWLTVYEIAPKSCNENEYINYIKEMTDRIYSFGFTDIFVQVRANGDAIYPSSIFPARKQFSSCGKLYYDALGIICECAHRNGLRIHVWINPYRLSSSIGKESTELPVGVDKDDVFIFDEKFYLNPCSENARTAILSGIREIIENYDIDGVHIDDYFYPTQDKKIDSKEFEAYIKNGGNLSLDDFRRNNVSVLVSSIYNLVKSKNESLLFTVSPGADIDKDRDLLYADVERWCKEDGYCDYIIPQIYFGFDNQNMPFEETLKEWIRLTENCKTGIITGLSIYKSGCVDKYAGENGKDEWIKNDDIIKREIELLREYRLSNFSIFSYNYVFGNRKLTKEEVKNLKSVI